jgi:hypothetical protein
MHHSEFTSTKTPRARTYFVVTGSMRRLRAEPASRNPARGRASARRRSSPVQAIRNGAHLLGLIEPVLRVASGGERMPAHGPADGPLRVIFVRSTRFRRSRHVRFAPIASEPSHRSESNSLLWSGVSRVSTTLKGRSDLCCPPRQCPLYLCSSAGRQINDLVASVTRIVIWIGYSRFGL